jgi:sucrose phosphorylase
MILQEKRFYYQVNATFFSALGENKQKLLLARATNVYARNLKFGI